MTENELLVKHSEIYKYLLDYKKLNPDFTFATRKKHNNHKDDRTKCRLCKGYKFQGSESYIFVPLYKIGSGHMINTIGFVYTDSQTSIVITSKDRPIKERDVYSKLIEKLSNMDEFELEQKHGEEYFRFIFKEMNLFNNLNYFISDFKIICDELIHQYKLESEFFITNEEFEKNIGKLNIEEKTVIQESKFNGKDDYQLQSLNQILYGPPGTGKTYNTINKAIEIIDKDFYELHKVESDENRRILKDKFEEYKDAGQIEFVTFHQSYGYEEFVEGIKAKTNDETKQIEYEIESGIFKRLCEKSLAKGSSNFNEKIEWLKSQCSEVDNKSLKIGSFTVTYRDGRTFRIKPDNSKNTETDYPASIENIEKIYKGGLRKEVYNPTYVVGILNYLYDNGLVHYDEIKEDNSKNYILIIDEINRGNISKIFGELITLIEDSKRIGKDEQIEITLPYSGEKFGVPKNLYILGTMNTADRSIALIDTALRRRFEFIEMMPKTELLDDLEVDGINIKLLLETINKRIEYLYDRDHTIGHAYFMSLKGIEKLDKKAELDNIFRNKIIPLLQEYFYDDWEKILMVLGAGFIDKDELKKDIFTYVQEDYIEDETKIKYTIKDSFDFSEYKQKDKNATDESEN